MTEIPKAQLVAYAAAGVLVVVAALRLFGGGDGDRGSDRPAVRLDEAAGAGSSAGGGRPKGAQIYVHVAGAVRRPGLYRVPQRARVAVAIERAGGPTPKAELAGVNLAASLEDGQQVIVPRRGAGGPAAASGAAGPHAGAATAAGGGAAGAGAQISLATATAEQLDGLDGIGPTLAKRIIEYRESKGGFRSLAQLREVEGIGPKRFEALKQSVRP